MDIAADLRSSVFGTIGWEITLAFLDRYDIFGQGKTYFDLTREINNTWILLRYCKLSLIL